MLTGGCFCGAVRYEADGPVSHETLCHCSICRRTSGAPCVAWLTVPASGLRLTTGEPATFRSSDHGTRGFCPRCGTPLTFASSKLPNEIDVTTCSLDDPEQLPPRDHTRTSARLSWMRVCDDLPAFDEERDSRHAEDAPLSHAPRAGAVAAPALSLLLWLPLSLGTLGTLGSTGCSTTHEAPTGASFGAPVQGGDRMISRSAEVAVKVDALDEAAASVTRLVRDAGGYVERSTDEADVGVWMTCRVPAPRLDTVIERIGALGTLERASSNAVDVTDEVEDLEARLANNRSLRDRLRKLLDRAADVDEVIRVERELVRVQSEIERMEARLERLTSEVSKSTLSVSLERKQILGPIGWVGYGFWWGVSKLFVIR